MRELAVLLDGREAGTVRQTGGKLSFHYSPSWRNARGAYPLSLSMPLAAADHPHNAIEPFMWGLLPDNEYVLGQWAKKFHVSSRNPFALVSHVGEDCAGAVQFVRPERLSAIETAQTAEVEWLTDAGVAARLRALRQDASAGRAPQDMGQFSLAGAQPKTALLFDGQRWGVPSGRTPTTHILKPPTAAYDGHAENEHLCLALARALGLPAARSEVRYFEKAGAIIITRFDRVGTVELAKAAAASAAAKAAEAALDSSPEVTASAMAEVARLSVDSMRMSEFSKKTPIYRVHQEDFCQALGVHPLSKYQNEGGPGPRRIVDCLRANASRSRPFQNSRSIVNSVVDTAGEDDVRTFIDALIFNWLIGGTDAHAKNYSILLGGDGLVRLAPLYDVASVLPYANVDPREAKLAMKIGGEYRMRDIGFAQWRVLAAEVKVDDDALVSRVRAMAAGLPDALSGEVAAARANGLTHALLSRLQEKLSERSRAIASM